MIALKRVYEPPCPEDGLRVLVERLWPRGLSKERAAVDLWLKDAAPSATASRDHVSGVKESTGGGTGGQTGSFEVREGFDQLGGDFARVAAADAGLCQARCAANPRCRAFTYDRRDGLCYLKDRSNVMRPASGKVTGARRD